MQVEVHLDDWVNVPILDHLAQGYRLTTWLDNQPAALHGVGGVREGVEVGLLTAGTVERVPTVERDPLVPAKEKRIAATLSRFKCLTKSYVLLQKFRSPLVRLVEVLLALDVEV